jgi:hypothetical protein
VTVATEIHRAHWTGERIGRLGFLLGLGWDAKRVAEDPIIASTQNNVHRQAQRFGLGFRAAAAALSLQLPPDAISRVGTRSTSAKGSCTPLSPSTACRGYADPARPAGIGRARSPNGPINWPKRSSKKANAGPASKPPIAP